MENMQLKSGGAEDSPLFWCVGPAHMPRTFRTNEQMDIQIPVMGGIYETKEIR